MSFAPEPALVSLLDCSGNPNYPADAIAGQQFTVSVAGKIGGASGKSVNVGDRITCVTANIGGTEASVGTSWVVENQSLIITAARTMTAAESGGTYFLNTAGGFTVTLPTAAIGLRYTFIVKTAPTTAYIILSATADTIFGKVFASSGGDENSNVAGDQINFVANTSLAGDRVELWSDGTSWFADGFCDVTGSITITG